MTYEPLLSDKFYTLVQTKIKLERRKMKKTIKTSAILLLLILTIGLPFFPFINTTKAANTYYTYIYVDPNPIGIGQRVNVGWGFTMPTSDPNYYMGWMLTITSPSGVNKTLGPFSSDSTGGTGISFTPDAVGTWLFQVYYPGGNVTYPAKPPYGVTTYNVPPAYSTYANLTVDTTTYLSFPPTNALPTTYWQYPVYGDNAQWYNISSNWLMAGYDTQRKYSSAVSGVFDPYTTVPTSAHILWTEPWTFGGVASYNTFTDTGLTKSSSGIETYYTGSSYREEVTPPIIINGRLYYNQVDPPAYGFYCVDLYNGQEIWFRNQTFNSGTGTIVQGTAAQLTLGQILIQNDENQNGAQAYLWAASGTTWARFDAYSGNLLNTIVNATAISTGNANNGVTYGPSGEILAYYFTARNSTAGYLALWNSTKCGLTATYTQTQQLNIPWKNGIQWNVTVLACPNEGSTNGDCTWDPKSLTAIIISNQTNGNPLVSGTFEDIAYSMVDGHVLWDKVRNTDGSTWEGFLYNSRSVGNNLYTIYRKETRQLYAFDVTTGNQMWVSEPRPNPLGAFGFGIVVAYGNVYQEADDGMVYAYDQQTGKTVWSFYDASVNPSGLEVPAGQYPLYGAMVVADGMLLVENHEHSEQSPLFRGEAMYAINASNGQLIWQVKGQYKQVSIAGGILVAPNLVDGQIYAFGMGPSKTTVNAPSVGVTTSTPITISGTVTDISAGSQQQAVAANFPNGLPCVSDDSMSQWMQHVYQQQPIPNNATGVPVTITVLDSNGNYRQIGNTSMMRGMFSFQWTPDNPGKYTVIASFAGSQSYYGSYAEAAFTATLHQQ